MKISSHFPLLKKCQPLARQILAQCLPRSFFLCALLWLATPPVAQATWETLLDGSSFNSAATFADAWYYNYPWGQTHNGSAKMWSSNDTFSAGVLTMQSVPYFDGTYNYSSGTIYSKVQVTLNSTCPTWDVSGEFQCESQRGTWPAFWLTGAWGWPPEVDQMEYKGSTTCWQNTYDGAWESLGTTVSSPGNWHTYRVVLSMANSTDVSVALYIDGALKTTQTGSGFVGQPMWIIIDYQMEGSSGSPGPTYTTYMRGRNVQISRDNLTTTAPGVPGGLTAAAGNAETALSWSPASGASTYTIKRSQTSGGPYTTIKTNLFSTSFTDTGLANGTTYYYVVSAVNPVGTSTSLEASGTTFTPAITPPDSGFETPVAEGYIYNPSGSSWTFSQGTGSGSGVTANGSAFTSGNQQAPEGVQVAFLQTTGTISQTFSGFMPGTNYILKFLASQRQNKSGGQVGETFDIQVNGSSIGSFEPTQSFAGYQEFTANFTANAASQTLSFVGTDLNGGDNTALIDRVLIAWQTPPPAPAAPTGLSAATLSASQIHLSWNVSSGATGYIVKRATTSGGPYTTVATGVSTTSYDDSGLASSTTYYYVVSALNDNGESANSSEANATTYSSIPVSNFGFETPVTSTYIYNPGGAAWTFSGSSGNGSGVTANNSGFTSGNAVAPEGSQVAFLQVNGTISQLLGGFAPGTTYTVTFAASQRQNKSGGQAGETFDVTVDGTVIGSFSPSQATSTYQNYSTNFTATATSHTLSFVGTDLNGGDNTVFIDNVHITSTGQSCALPAPPTGLSATGGDAQIALNWTGSTNANSYAVYRANSSSGPYSLVASGVLTTAYTDIGLAGGTTYFYVVDAVNSCGASGDSAYAGATTIPSAPSGLTATAGSNQVALSWTASTGAATYNVKRATTSGGPYTTIVTGVGATSYTDINAANGTTYYYVVSAANNSGESSNSSEVSATPEVPATLAAPTNLTATPAHRGQITLRWNQSVSPNISANNIYRATTSGGPYTLAASVSAATSYKDSHLSSGTTYYYVVTALNGSGQESNYSNEAGATAP